MIDPSTLLLFSVTSIFLIITPGPNLIYIITRSVGQGRTAGVASALGVDTGVLVHVAAAAAGLSALIVSSAIAFSVVKYLGAAYLVFLGLSALLKRSDKSYLSVEDVPSQSLKEIYLQGVLTNIFNPKVAVFFLAFLPQFLDSSAGNVVQQTLLLGAVFVGIGLAIDLMVAWLIGLMGDWLKQSPRFWQIQRWLTGSVFIVLGLSTAFSSTKN